MYRRNRWIKHIDFVVLDIICLVISFVLGYYFRNDLLKGNLWSTDIYRSMLFFLIFADLFVSAAFNTMHNVLKRGYGIELWMTLRQVLGVFSITVVYMFSMKSSAEYSRVIIYITMLIYYVLSYSVRLVWKKLVRGILKKKPRAMLVVSSSQQASFVLSHLSRMAEELSSISGLILTDDAPVGGQIDGVPVCASIDGAVDFIRKNWVDEVFIDPTERSEQIQELIEECRRMGVTIHEAFSLDNSIGNRQYLEKIGSYQVVTSRVNMATPFQMVVKRIIDVCAGLAGIMVTGLILLFVAPKIKKASPGPIFFKQDRVGQNGRIFKFVKIRSMYLDAEERKKELMAQNRVADGMMFKMDFDPRIIGNEILPDGTKKTGIGQFIRNTSLDEFPQFWNVLKGDMSLVGTRPPTLDEWEKYDTHHRARLAMKPGITGMWQVSGRSDITDFEEVVRLDTDYIYNWSLLLDFKIIFKTFAVLFKKEGAM